MVVPTARDDSVSWNPSHAVWGEYFGRDASAAVSR